VSRVRRAATAPLPSFSSAEVQRPFFHRRQVADEGVSFRGKRRAQFLGQQLLSVLILGPCRGELAGRDQQANQVVVALLAQGIGRHRASRPLQGPRPIPQLLQQGDQSVQRQEECLCQAFSFREDPVLKTAGEQLPSILLRSGNELLCPLGGTRGTLGGL
jgi:hypothetical protein